MPVYELLGGKCREAAAVYGHAGGNSPEAVADSVRGFMENGYRYIRIQMGGYGGEASRIVKPEGALDGAYFDPREYTLNMLRMIEHVRSEVGDGAELLHDIHERLHPIDAVKFAKDVEPFNLFFLEDPLAGWQPNAPLNPPTPIPPAFNDNQRSSKCTSVHSTFQEMTGTPTRCFPSWCVNHVSSNPPGEWQDWDADVLSQFKEKLASLDISLDMMILPLASGPARTQGAPHVFLGPSPELDRELDQICDLLRNMARAGIPAGRYNITILGHLRTERRFGTGWRKFVVV